MHLPSGSVGPGVDCKLVRLAIWVRVAMGGSDDSIKRGCILCMHVHGLGTHECGDKILKFTKCRDGWMEALVDKVHEQ